MCMKKFDAEKKKILTKLQGFFNLAIFRRMYLVNYGW